MQFEFEDIEEVKFLNPKLGFLRNGLLPKRGKGKRNGLAAARSVTRGATPSVGNPADTEDGDGDGLIFDGTPMERPAVNAATEVAGRAASSAAGSSDLSGTTGLNANDRVRAMVGRMGAKKPKRKGRGPKWYWDQPEPDYRTRGEKVRDTIYGAFDMQRPDPRKVRATEEEITDARQLRAARSTARAKNIGKSIRTEMDDPSQAFTWEDRQIIAQQFLDDMGIDLDGLTDEDRAEVIDEAARILDDSDELGNDLTKYKPRTDGVSQRKVRELTTIVADRSPVMAHLMERNGGAPRVMMIDDFGDEMEEVLGADASVLRETIDAFYHRDGDMIALNGRFMDSDMDEPDTLPNEYGFGRIGQSMDTVFRHEYGHRMMWQAVYNGTPEQQEAVDGILKYYERHHKPHKARRNALAQTYGDEGEEAAKELLDQMKGRGTSSRSGPNKGVEATMWMTEYGHTNRTEFMAELFAMATSQNPDVVDAIPQELRPMIAAWLGVERWF